MKNQKDTVYYTNYCKKYEDPAPKMSVNGSLKTNLDETHHGNPMTS